MGNFCHTGYCAELCNAVADDIGHQRTARQAMTEVHQTPLEGPYLG